MITLSPTEATAALRVASADAVNALVAWQNAMRCGEPAAIAAAEKRLKLKRFIRDQALRDSRVAMSPQGAPTCA